MALALANAGRLNESRDALLDVLALLPSERTPERLAIVAQTAGVEHLLGRHGDARRRLLAALEDAPPEGRAALALEMAAAGYYAGDAAAMRDWGSRAVNDAEGQDALRAGAEGLGALGAQRTGDADAAATLLDRAIDRLARIEDPGDRRRAEGRDPRRHGGAARRALRGRLRDARPRALGRARHAPGRHARPARDHPRALQRQRLNIAEALADVEVAEEGARLQGVDSMLHAALWTKAILHHDRGEGSEAERAAAESARAARRARAERLHAHGRCAAAAIHDEQDPERCIREMTAAGGPMLEGVDETWRTWLLLVLVRAAVATERIDEAREWAAELARHAKAMALPAGAVRAECARAELLLAGGKAAEAGRVAMAPPRPPGASAPAATSLPHDCSPAARSPLPATAPRPWPCCAR